MKVKHILLGVLVLSLALILGACSSAPPVECPEVAPCPECQECPEAECPACPEPEALPESAVDNVPFEEAWVDSAHNDAEAEAFNHWNEDDPAAVPTSCASCHTTEGYVEFVTTGAVAEALPAPAGTIQCVACHNEATAVMTSVKFPYTYENEEGEMVQAEITGLGPEARCMVCHQGRASKSSVDDALAKFGATEDLDTVPEAVDESTLGFINIHYFPAAATLYGTAVKGGYEYDGKAYDFKNDHVDGYNSCVGCHSPHSLELKLEECATCHTGVASVEDVRAIRMEGSMVDYDGDGDVEEGISEEVAGLREMLYTAIQAYGSEVGETGIVYDAASYPYFFDEAGERYTNWTGRLLKAAYNYQMATKDPGAYAHGGKYIIQLLYDSIEDLNTAISTPVDLSAAQRIDAGHFAGSEEAFRHWDEGGEVEAGCAKCHSAAGLAVYLKEGVNVSEHLANGLKCATCHNDLTTFTRFPVDKVSFPSGASLGFATGEDVVDSDLCINCHQGRQSGSGLAGAIARAAVGADEASEALRFSNPHYFAAGATLFGTEAGGPYEYEGKEYNGQNKHVPGFDNCQGCHDVHALKVKVEACKTCHTMVASEEDLDKIRITEGDFDGDGDGDEGIAMEVEHEAEALYAAMQAYAADNGLPGIVWNGAAYPYWFTDTNGNGEADPDESVSANGYASWTPRLLQAAYNYTWVQKDPGAFAHNGMYILQVLYDSLEDVGADVGGMIRPEVKASE